MKVTFKYEGLLELYEYGKSSDKKYKPISKDKSLIEGFIRAVNIMRYADNTKSLYSYSFLHYEKLKNQGAENRGSVRIKNGDIRRLIFTETSDGIEVELIEIDDKHYGNKH
jgi:plasmid maintenance system killer protein